MQRRPLIQMARIIREVVRQAKRRTLATSTWISLSLDDRKGYKLVRYRAALLGGLASGSSAASARGPAASQGEGPVASQSSSLEQYFVEGILGCIQCLHGASLEDLAEDYALRASKEVIELLQRFCTPEGETVRNDVLYNHVLATVRSVVADGALQKVAQFLKIEYMPNIVLIARDPAHMIRIACKEPLVRTSGFEEQNERLFGKKNGILKKIQFSDALQARLEACQRVVLLHRRTQGGDVKQVMRHFSFAPHRFESWTGPRRKYICCMHAIALLLAEMAGDSRRLPSERALAEESLKSMTCQNLIEVGLAADFGEICMRYSERSDFGVLFVLNMFEVKTWLKHLVFELLDRFLRKFDVADRDPARTVVELQEFELTLRKLFVEGYIAVAPAGWSPHSSRDDPAASRDRGARGDPEAKTLTHVVFDELREVNELRYGDKVHVLFRDTDKGACQDSIRRIGEVVTDCLARVRADFAPSDLYMAFEVMDMKQWIKISEQKQQSLRMKARRLCEALAITYTWDKWKAAIRFVETERRRRTDRDVDNRLVWADAFAASQRQNPSPLADFEQLVAFYIGLTDGTGNIERYLGAHAAFLAHHHGSQETEDSDMCEICLEIAKEGPQTEEALFTKSEQHPGVLLLTDFSRRCAELWRGLHGRRFGCYKPRKDKGTKLARRLKGTHKAVGMMQERATKDLVDMAQEDDRALAASREPLPRSTFWGQERRKFMQRVQKTAKSQTSKALANFRRTTENTKKRRVSAMGKGFLPSLPRCGRSWATGLRCPWWVPRQRCSRLLLHRRSVHALAWRVLLSQCAAMPQRRQSRRRNRRECRLIRKLSCTLKI